MVKKNVLNKLSNKELENYLKIENRFVPEAVQVAFEILEERGRIFTEVEKIDIQNIIQSKKKAETSKNNEEIQDWKDHITTDSTAIQLYSRALIWISSLFLGTLFGAILLSLNLLKLKKYLRAIFTFLFGIIYIPFQHYAYNLLIENNLVTTSRYSPEMLPIIVGPLILILFWVTALPKRIVYRSQSYLFPIIFAVIMLFVIFINYKGLFSSYFLLRFSE